MHLKREGKTYFYAKGNDPVENGDIINAKGMKEQNTSLPGPKERDRIQVTVEGIDC